MKRNPYATLARSSISYFLETGRTMELAGDMPQELLDKKAGAFVTLYKGDELRGCVGTITPVRETLAEEIIRNALTAAFRDPRFPPLEEEELTFLTISVDVLSEPEEIESMAELDPDRYGVIVSCGYRRGLLLPDLDGVDSPEEQVSIALRKAGILPDESYTLERFSVTRHQEND